MLIGLAGYARSGKDTLGEILAKEHGFRVTAFASLMRECALALNPIVGTTTPTEYIRYKDLVTTVGYDRAKECAEVREFLQRLGTEMGRFVFGTEFWIKQTFARMDLTSHDWAITDVRFPNEGYAVKDHKGIVVRVHRPGIGPANDHDSERAMDAWSYDYWINNSEPLDMLKPKVRELLAWMN